MRTRFAVVAVAVMLTTPACRSTKDNNLPKEIRNTPAMVETARDVMANPIPKPVEKVPPKTDVAETHQAEVLKTTPQPTKAGSAPKIQLRDIIPKAKSASGIIDDNPKFKDKIDVQMSH